MMAMETTIVLTEVDDCGGVGDSSNNGAPLAAGKDVHRSESNFLGHPTSDPIMVGFLNIDNLSNSINLILPIRSKLDI